MRASLPSGWTCARLPELIGTGGTFTDGDWVESKDQDALGNVRLIQLADIGDGKYLDKSNRFLTREKAVDLRCTFLERGDILIARMPDPLGRACIFPGDRKLAVTVVDVCVIRSASNEYFNPSWLMHFINANEFREKIDGLQSGTTRKRISRGNLATLRIPFPPRYEQDRIVEKLEELLSDLDAGVQELKAAQKTLTKYRQSLLKAAVDGTLTALWREARRQREGESEETGAQLLERILTERRARWEARQLAKFEKRGKTPLAEWKAGYPAPAAGDMSGLPVLPRNWVWASANELIAESSYGTSVKCCYESAGTPVLRIPNVVARTLDLSDLKFAAEPLALDAFEFLAPGDILIVRTNGSIGLVGRAAEVMEKLPGDFFFASYLLRLRCVEIFTIPKWISMYLGASAGRAWIEQRAASSAGQNNISLSTLLTIPIPLPPIAEQREAINILQSFFRLISDMQSEIQRGLRVAAAQRHNILKAALSGQLVSQDPSDEPASVLLERIRTERAARDSNGSARKRKAKATA